MEKIGEFKANCISKQEEKKLRDAIQQCGTDQIDSILATFDEAKEMYGLLLLVMDGQAKIECDGQIIIIKSRKYEKPEKMFSRLVR